MLKNKNSAVYGMGVAIDDITRLKKVIRDLPSLKKVFSEREIGYCMRYSFSEEHFAVRLAAKEATIKALGRKGGGISMDKIEILNRKDGAPYVNIKTKKLKDKYEYFISLSHSDTKALAYSIIKEKRP